jgi:hypothetical protein
MNKLNKMEHLRKKWRDTFPINITGFFKDLEDKYNHFDKQLIGYCALARKIFSKIS